MTERVRCELCGKDDSISLFQRYDRFSPEVFQYVRCRHCGLIYLDPRPTEGEIGAYYPGHYEAFQSPLGSGMVQRARQNHAMGKLRRFVSQHCRSGHLLDVGCATGEFLVEMRSHGWQVMGIELSSTAASVAREVYGLDVFGGSASDFQSTQSFDVITLWDVLEHLHAPRQTLKRLGELLADDGFIAFSVPNLGSFDKYLFGDDWIGWDAPRHLYLFSDRTLRKLLNQAGLEVVARRCFLGEPGAFLLSLGPFLRHHLRIKDDRRATMPLLDTLLVHLIWPYKTLSYALGRGSITHYVARKRGVSVVKERTLSQ